MAAWLVTANESQFSVDGLSELKDLARNGQLKSGDLIQPPGAADWVYASEVPELKGVLDNPRLDLDDDGPSPVAQTANNVVMIGLAGVFAVILVVTLIGIGVLVTMMPDSQASIIGKGGFSENEMLVTESGSPLLGAPEAKAPQLKTLDKNDALTLLTKRGGFYKARTKDGAEGWISVQHVIPMYQLGDEAVQKKYDPIYNPDRYIDIVNSRWSQLPDSKKSITVFQFMLQNSSPFDITDVVLEATIKDAQGAVAETVEIPIEGILPSNASTMVGTLKGEKKTDPLRIITDYSLQIAVKDDPDLQLRYADGIEVKMESGEFTEAKIVLLQARAMVEEGAAPK